MHHWLMGNGRPCCQSWLFWRRMESTVYNSVSQTVVRGPLGVREALTGKRGNYCFHVEFREKNV